MRTGLSALACFGGVAAFASCGLSLALLGLGLPYLLAAALSGALAGLLIYALGRWAADRAAPVIAAPALADPPAPDPAALAAAERLSTLEREMSGLRHELRGALSPALMVSDRLLRHDDPIVRRAGDAVVRSVERATALIGNDAARGEAVSSSAPEVPPPRP